MIVQQKIIFIILLQILVIFVTLLVKLVQVPLQKIVVLVKYLIFNTSKNVFLNVQNTIFIQTI
jgi:hypothetical protein